MENIIRKNVACGIMNCYGVTAIYTQNDQYGYGVKNLLALSIMDSSANLLKGTLQSIRQGNMVYIDCERHRSKQLSTKGFQFKQANMPIRFGRNSFRFMQIINKEVGKRFLITDEENLEADFFSFVMSNYHITMLPEWTKKVRSWLIANDYLKDYQDDLCWQYDDQMPTFRIHGKELNLRNLRVYDFDMVNEAALKDCLTDLLSNREVEILDENGKGIHVPDVEFSGFDDFVGQYGQQLAKTFDESLPTLTTLNGELPEVAFNNKTLYPQQAAAVNGMIARKEHGYSNGLMVEAMGCGKTIQALAVVEGAANRKAMRVFKNTHKGVHDAEYSVRDVYSNDELFKLSYHRTIVMCPPHLCEKWAQEIRSEVPNATVSIIHDLKDLVAIREAGNVRTGKEYHIISMTSARQASQSSPIPTMVGRKVPTALICKECFEEDESVVYKAKAGDCACEKCGSKKWMRYEVKALGNTRGMICPSCGNLLIKPKNFNKGLRDDEQVALVPSDFASATTLNDKCFVCDSPLWGVDCLDNSGKERDKKWYKVTHFKNHQKKSKKTAWVLKNHEGEYYSDAQLDGELLESVTKSKVQYGPRKTSLAQYIKKHLKGYFDYCILDECHKYEGAGTAQAVAAHALIKSSGFTLGLTGTITNGKANSLFFLLYMLEPRKMRAKGFEHSDYMKFAQVYGKVETTYEFNGNDDEDGVVKNSNSRGKQIGQPKIQPGISPLVYTDFLIENSVFLDLSDLSKYMPKLKEEVVVCPCPDDVSMVYHNTVNTLTGAIHEKGGRALLSSLVTVPNILADKPYGLKPIMHPYNQDEVVCKIKSLDEYETELTLPKEDKLCEIINREIAEDRNCFVYTAYTGSAEYSVNNRLKELIESRCNLRGQVFVLESNTVSAKEREQYIHEKAAEGIRIFICNAKLVETGLDFCFKHEGQVYNYPNIIFYQTTYELAVMWQASRRHFRLNQREECHTYYMATEHTVQTGIISLMAEKQVAASAIQGKFSSEGLAAMANGVDAKVKLAQMLAEHDEGVDRDSLENMFDVLNDNTNSEDNTYDKFRRALTFAEAMQGAEIVSMPVIEETEVKSVVTTKKKAPVKKLETVDETQLTIFDNEVESSIKPAAEVKTSSVEQFNLFDMFGGFDVQPTAEVKTVATTVVKAAEVKKVKKAKKITNADIKVFDLFSLSA